MCGSERFTAAGTPRPTELGTWGREGHSKGGKPGHGAGRGKAMQKTQGGRLAGGPAHSNRWECSTDKMVYWCCSPNVQGYSKRLSGV